jgi:hypothetical protein
MEINQPLEDEKFALVQPPGTQLLNVSAPQPDGIGAPADNGGERQNNGGQARRPGGPLD